MVHRISLFLILLCILPDWYIYRHFIKCRTQNKWLRLLYWIPSIMLIAFLCYLMQGNNFTPERVQMTGIYFIAYMILTVPKTMFCLISLLFKTLQKIWQPAKKYGTPAALSMATISLCIIVYGSLVGATQYQIKEITFYSAELPKQFDGYKIVQFSDMHIGTITGHPKQAEKIVELINAQNPDLIVFTGDLINNLSTELDGFEEILSKLKAKDGVYSVLGNHDYSPYFRWKSKDDCQKNLEDLERREGKMGWKLLNNSHALLHRGDTCIALIGVENDGIPPFPEKGDLYLATQGTKGLFKVLLSHDPTHWRRKVLPTTDIQLMLAGHTHAMQFALGNFSPSSWFYKEWHGMYMEGTRGLYVNIGIGSVMMPFRFGAWPEITVITLTDKLEKK